MRRLLAAASLAASLAACAPPKNYTPVDQIPQITDLEAVMDVQATTADPQFRKMDQASYSPAELASLDETARRIDAASRRTKAFSKGPAFDALADRLGAHAVELGRAANAGDVAGVHAALAAMKATCKQCHHEFR